MRRKTEGDSVERGITSSGVEQGTDVGGESSVLERFGGARAGAAHHTEPPQANSSTAGGARFRFRFGVAREYFGAGRSPSVAPRFAARFELAARFGLAAIEEAAADKGAGADDEQLDRGTI